MWEAKKVGGAGICCRDRNFLTGAAAWLVHGSLWALFHLFFQWTLQNLTHMLPTCCALAFVAQHRKNTWPGIIAHTFGNSALMLQIFRGISG
jgi:hypothetical protein